MWIKYQNMEEAMTALPKGSEKGAEDAVPDVYGKAVRLYTALYESYRMGKNGPNSEEVLLWRGLITLLALQGDRKFPLSWEKVSLPAANYGETDNLLDSALRHPPGGEKSAFPDGMEGRWNGTDFYVLKWTMPERESDLLLFSPLTLVYPVADWRQVFAELEGAPDWFDLSRRTFLPPETVLNEREKEIVAFWLERASRELNAEKENEVRQVVKAQVDHYIADLCVNITDRDRERLSLSEIGGGTCPRELPRLLCETVEMTVWGLKTANGSAPAANALFSDQICYYRSDTNLFTNCRNHENYFISFSRNMYAFLPVHPQIRQNNLSQSVSMSLIYKGKGCFIRAELEFDGKKYERDYQLCETYTSQPDMAVPYCLSDTLDKSSAPFISVWPHEINDTWDKYYIMLDDSKCGAGDLQIDHEEKGSNRYARMTRGMPDMIPILRCYRDGTTRSVGIVTPMLPQPMEREAGIPAVVAVDFGTSSTRVYAKIEKEIEEISVMDAEPLSLTEFDVSREYLMRDYFIPPRSFRENLNTLFSIYRRSIAYPRSEVRPILDGVIFQQSTQKILEVAEDSENLISNLKWELRQSKEYYIAFMKQLLFHIVCLLKKKGVNSIRWKYALPESMPSDDRETVRGIWKEKLLPYLKEISGKITHTVDDSLSESEAASRYFLFRRDNAVQARKGFLVVDIGGGSTDLALWQGEGNNARMKWHASITVAGRKMFTRWVARDLKSFCDNLSKTNENIAGQLNLIENVEDSSLKNSLIEMLLDANYSALLEEYRQECRESTNGWGAALRTRINLALSLLMFALGCQVGAMLSEGTFTIPEGLGAFGIAFGGKGANILQWRGYDEELLTKMFREGAAAFGAEINSDIQIEKSEDVKCEVAKGLLMAESAEAADLSEQADICLDAAEYVRITNAFLNAFHKMFSGSPLTVPAKIDKNVLAAQIEGYTGGNDQIVKVLMDEIYEDLAE